MVDIPLDADFIASGNPIINCYNRHVVYHFEGLIKDENMPSKVSYNFVK